MTTLPEGKVEAVLLDPLAALGYCCISDVGSGLDGTTPEPMTKARQMSEAVL
ncbi:hypothetical protein [Defluviimonas sp. WL0075]|uniref:Uncharacterized protein n=1 Tax=Albidovulum sediminicola TaxID=2984331 RepID=A0ABT2Z1J4_9RHOB|nr:hypothetical protein [Defluviimonas sp. WL0075]MCV2865018.1 hypothetical protein [Defluviimonas sp. WL0075]